MTNALDQTRLYDRLAADVPVAALVDTRIYPAGEVPQQPTLPYLTYQRITTNEIDAMDGYSGLEQATFDVNCWASNHLAASQLADATRDAIRNGTANNFRAVITDSSAIDEDTSKEYRWLIECSIWHTE